MVEIYGLYGKSGTGKSYKSSELVARYQIDAVLDDGLLIKNRKRVAGKSAKNERTAFRATKTAILFEESHRQEVMDCIWRMRVRRILVIGTSRKMVERIVSRLELPDPVVWLPIESFQTTEEIKLARNRRRIGYHVIPIRPVEVSQTFYGWFSKQVISLGKRSEEVTIVKPRFMRDIILVHPQCVEDIVSIFANPLLHIHSVSVEWERVTIKLSSDTGCTIANLQQWKEQLTSVLRYYLEIPYTVDLEWRAIIPDKRRGMH